MLCITTPTFEFWTAVVLPIPVYDPAPTKLYRGAAVWCSMQVHEGVLCVQLCSAQYCIATRKALHHTYIPYTNAPSRSKNTCKWRHQSILRSPRCCALPYRVTSSSYRVAVVQTEAQTPDAWIGLLREPRAPGQPLGPTHKAMMIEQFGRIFFGRRGQWWQRDLLRFVGIFGYKEVRQTSMAQIIRDNTDADVHGNVFVM